MAQRQAIEGSEDQLTAMMRRQAEQYAAKKPMLQDFGDRMSSAASTLTSGRRPLNDPDLYLDPEQVPREGYGATALKNLVGAAMEAQPDNSVEIADGIRIDPFSGIGALSRITDAERAMVSKLLHGHIPKMLEGRAGWRHLENGGRGEFPKEKTLGMGVHATSYDLSPDKILKVPNSEYVTDDMLQRIAMDANLSKHGVAPEFKWGVATSPEMSAASSGRATRIPFKIEERLHPTHPYSSVEDFGDLKNRARSIGALPSDVDLGHNVGVVRDAQPGANNLRIYDSGHFSADSSPIDLQKLLMENQLDHFPPHGNPGELTIAPRRLETIQDFLDSMAGTEKKFLGTPVPRAFDHVAPKLGQIVPRK